MQRALAWSILCSWLPERTACLALVWVNVRRPQGLFCWARLTDQRTGCKIPCFHLSTWFNSWLWLKIHDCVLVVAKGTLIDWGEIYSAVADCKDGAGDQAGLLYVRFTTDVVSHNLAHPRFQVAFSKQFPFLFPTDLSFFIICCWKQTCHFYKGLLNSDSSNPAWPPPPPSPLLFVLKLSLGIFKKWKGQSFGHSPAEVQMGQHMEAISGPGALQSKVDCSLSSEPLKNRLAALTCEQRLGLDWCIDSLSLFTNHTQ